MSKPILKLPLRCDGQEIYDASNILIAQIWSNDPFTTLNRDSVRAREIVRRVNAFDALIHAANTALHVISEISDIDAENRAGWAHKELDAAITAAEKEVS